MPALTLGCGAIGGSATSDNVGPMNLLNLRHVAYGVKEIEDIRRDSVQVDADSDEITSVQIDAIVQKIIERLRAM